MKFISPPTFISLFSGCGGMDLGFIDAGFKCAGAFDNNKDVVNVHNINLGNKARLIDLSKATGDELSCKSQPPDLVLAGSPCQGFSTAGKRQLNDPRNSLLVKSGDLALKIKPKIFIAENVLGSLSGDHKTYWNQLETKLNKAGYKTTTLKLNASDLGLAQRRVRVFLIAWNTKKEFNFLEPDYKNKNLRDALSNIEGLTHHEKIYLALNSKHQLIANRIKNGEKLCNVRGGKNSIHTWDIPEVFGKITNDERKILEMTMYIRRRERIRDRGDADPVSIDSLIRDFGKNAPKIVRNLVAKNYMKEIGDKVDLVNTFNGKYKRLQWDAVSKTVDTRFGNPLYFLHPDDNRGFTVREAARIQGFPDTFQFSGRKTEDYKMIGNAVPPLMGEFVAHNISALL